MKKAWFVTGLAAAWVSYAGDLQPQSTLFAPGTQVDVGPGSGNIVLADVDRDGHVDMLTQHLLQRKIGVFLGDGKGGFKPAAGSPIPLDYQPGSIALADLDGDGRLDLAVGQSERDAADVLLGDGKGTFKRASGAPFAASASKEFFTRQVWIADLNGDRRLDIVTANGAANALGILFGDGRGGFSPGPVTKRESKGKRHAFAFGDVDGDGKIDTVVASRGPDAPEGHVAILRGDGTGVFTEAGPALAVAAGPRFAALADCNGDRRLDLLLCHDNRRISILLNQEGGKLVHAPGSPLDAGAEAYMVVVADANGDGKPDLIAATVEDVTVLLGDGRGRFTPAPGSPFRAGPGSYKIAAADLNGDGKLDVVASSFEGSAVTVLLGR